MDKEKAINTIKQLARIYRGTIDEHQAIADAIKYLEEIKEVVW